MGKKEKERPVILMVCQACRKTQSMVIEKCDDEIEPYILCSECHIRLLNYSLRPIEWYNLASIHTYNKYHLHDDFYDDNGLAYQPEIKVDKSCIYEAPTLKGVSDSVPDLIDYAISKWWMNDEIVEALTKHDSMEIFELIKLRSQSTKNVYVKSRLYEIAYKVLGPICEKWIRENWDDVENDLLIDLSIATCYCMPFEEGYELVIEAMKNIPDREKSDVSYLCLYSFRSDKALDWIEENIGVLHKIDSVARLVVASNPSWSKLYEWIQKGRPLSLIAITALGKMVPNPNENLLKKLNPRPVLNEPAEIELMTKVLNDYALIDNVPRVKNNIKRLINNWDEIL